jgi:hypothetical protein
LVLFLCCYYGHGYYTVAVCKNTIGELQPVVLAASLAFVAQLQHCMATTLGSIHGHFHLTARGRAVFEGW